MMPPIDNDLLATLDHKTALAELARERARLRQQPPKGIRKVLDVLTPWPLRGGRGSHLQWAH